MTSDELRAYYTAKERGLSTRTNGLHEALLDSVRAMRPRPATAFEFGCNVGRNLMLLWTHLHVCGMGLDLAEKAVMHRWVTCVRQGDEANLAAIASDSFDLVFTLSVLCHMHEVEPVIGELERIARRHVLLIETTEKPLDNYVSHDYESYGYDWLWEVLSEPGNGCLYRGYYKQPDAARGAS